MQRESASWHTHALILSARRGHCCLSYFAKKLAKRKSGRVHSSFQCARQARPSFLWCHLAALKLENFNSANRHPLIAKSARTSLLIDVGASPLRIEAYLRALWLSFRFCALTSLSPSQVHECLYWSCKKHWSGHEARPPILRTECADAGCQTSVQR